MTATNVYTAEEAAGILRVKQSWLERQAAFRRVPFTMLGGCYRFTETHLTEIIRIFENGPVEATPEPVPASLTRLPRSQRGSTSQIFAPLRPRPRSSAPQAA